MPGRPAFSATVAISSSSTLGNTSLTLEFIESRDIDAASVDVQAALLRAQRSRVQETREETAAGTAKDDIAVTPLAGDTRVEEIARMLGGLKITSRTRAHADEMLKGRRRAG